MSHANEPAYPVVFRNTGDMNISAQNGEVVAPGCEIQLPGLTIREHFAAMAMQGLLSNPEAGGTGCRPGMNAVQTYAAAAVEMADALIAELAKVQP